MNLVILDAATYGEISLEPLTRGFTSVSVHQATRPDQTLARVREAAVVVTNKVVLDRATITAAADLELICVAATGTDTIDLEAARAAGIAVTNVPGYATAAVVSHTFALYFHLAHHNAYHDAYTREKRWCDSPVFNHLDRPYRELAGQTWGVIGMGAIGSGVARVAETFGCRVVYHSTSGTNLEQPWPHLDSDALLREADIVSIHAPLNERTHGLIGASELARMRRHAILINVGRGAIIDQGALARALDAGTIAAAGIDVMPEEPPPRDHPLLNLAHPERLFTTPHIAGLSIQARARLIDAVHANIEAYRAGERRNRVD